TQPNRFYLHSAQSGGRKNNDLPPALAGEHPEWLLGWDWPTIWTLLDRAGVSGSYYFSNLPEIAFWGLRHLNKARHVAEFFLACELGTLPQVSFIDPWFTGPEGIANDDHPWADVRLGQQFLSDIVEAFTTSPHYRKGALVITYDEWGGFWDHVDPPRVVDDRATPADPGGVDDFGQLGFRIPTTIVSPWTRGGGVDHTVYEHSSILRFISDNWGLPYLTARHASTNSIETAFRAFTSYQPEAPFQRYQAPLQLLLEPTLDRLAQGELPDLLPVSVQTGLTASSAPGPISDLHRLAEIGWFDSLPVRIDWRIEDSFLRTPTALLAEVRALLTR
ncbi:MAG: alkaline phosphatase family protein, partial [Acidimicrobiales bacterium]